MRYLSFQTLPAELLETVLSDIASAVMDAPIDLGGFTRRGFKSDRRTRRLRAGSVEVVDGNLVTGQNQNSGAETAHRMLELLADR